MGKTTGRASAAAIARTSSSGVCFMPSGSFWPMWVWTSYSASGPCRRCTSSHQGRRIVSTSTMGRGTLQAPRLPSDTDRMHFRRERVRIETARHEIVGTLQLPAEGFRSRTTDFLNATNDEFLALTDAEVTYLDDVRASERH